MFLVCTGVVYFIFTLFLCYLIEKKGSPPCNKVFFALSDRSLVLFLARRQFQNKYSGCMYENHTLCSAANLARGFLFKNFTVLISVLAFASQLPLRRNLASRLSLSKLTIPISGHCGVYLFGNVDLLLFESKLSRLPL